MGGGAAMRAVGKAAGIGLMNSGIRGRLSEHPVSAATRSVARPMTAIGGVSTAESIKPIEIHDDAHKSASEIDDWDFADLTEESVVGGSGDKNLARVVFYGVPTLDEAKEATSELKEVLEKEYFTKTTSPKFGNTSPGASFFLENSEVGQSKGSLTIESPGSTHAVQAFKSLSENPAIQAVVAAIACDPNVWNSVLGNPTLQEYIQAQKIDFKLQHLYPGVEESFADASQADKMSVTLETASQTDESDGPESQLEDILTNAWINTKDAVVEMMNSLSGFFQNLFSVNPSGKLGSDPNVPSGSFVEKALGPSIMGLVIMVIMVVVLKRS